MVKGRLSIGRPDTTAIETVHKRAKQIIFYVFRTVGEFTTKSICCTIDIAKLSVHVDVILQITCFFKGSGYFAVDGNLPSETILP